MSKKMLVWLLVFVLCGVFFVQSKAEPQVELIPRAYLPIVVSPSEFACATSSTNQL